MSGIIRSILTSHPKGLVITSSATVQIPRAGTPEELIIALQQSTALIRRGFVLKENLFAPLFGKTLEFTKEEEVNEEVVDPSEVLKRPVETLEVSVRVYSCLKNANIKTIGELVNKSEAELLPMKNFGRKSMSEIKDVLAALGLSLRQ